MKIQFITDIEGHLSYLKRQIENSEVLEFASDGSLDFKSDDGYFVFGGDVCDRGEDITVTKLLLALKEKYPDRVI